MYVIKDRMGRQSKGEWKKGIQRTYLSPQRYMETLSPHLAVAIDISRVYAHEEYIQDIGRTCQAPRRAQATGYDPRGEMQQQRRRISSLSPYFVLGQQNFQLAPALLVVVVLVASFGVAAGLVVLPALRLHPLLRRLHHRILRQTLVFPLPSAAAWVFLLLQLQHHHHHPYYYYYHDLFSSTSCV